jgi:hypothetical protein
MSGIVSEVGIDSVAAGSCSDAASGGPGTGSDAAADSTGVGGRRGGGFAVEGAGAVLSTLGAGGIGLVGAGTGGGA